MTWRALLWWRPPCLLRRVIVNLTAAAAPDTALSGVLWRSRGAYLVLRDVRLLKAQEKPMPVDGEVILHRDQVAFIQAVP